MVPPADPSESCTGGDVCDDTGRCVDPDGPVQQTATLSASPASVRTVADGPAKSVQARLTAFTADRRRGEHGRVRRADLGVVRLDTAGALDQFRHGSQAYDSSSKELSLMGLYGDYVLLFPYPALDAGLNLGELFDFNVRFDIVSVDDTPALRRRTTSQGPPSVRVEIDRSGDPIVVD